MRLPAVRDPAMSDGDDVKMALKILYVLDNGSSGTYLARSRSRHSVRVFQLPQGDEDIGGAVRIGAVKLSGVLQEVYKNSPELWTNNVQLNGYDYNLYYKDICEVDEPLVSLGVLSRLQDPSSSDQGGDEEEPVIVTGRVCTNFATAFLKNKDNVSNDTLEVKLQFSKMVLNTSAVNSRRGSVITTKNDNNNNNNNNNYATPPFKVVRPTVKSNATKRQTNPMPAPKAKRTQSLPIWDQRLASTSQGLPTNSIAHKIFLADKKNQAASQNTSYSTHNAATSTAALASQYRVPANQQDNLVNDSVKKRFDFMLNKKKKQPGNNSKNGKRRNSASTKTTTTTNKKQKISNKSKQAGPVKEVSNNLESNTNSSFFHQLMLSDDMFGQEKLLTIDENKENIPPQNVTSDKIDVMDGSNYMTFQLKEDQVWLDEFNPFNSPLLNNILSNKASSTTPKDVNTCNTEPIDPNNDEEDDDGRNKIPIPSDADRTSPIDTLSMPLMELSQCSNPRILTSCHDQLQKLPLLGNTNRTSRQSASPMIEQRSASLNDENDSIDDATSIVMNFSTPAAQDTPVGGDIIKPEAPTGSDKTSFKRAPQDNIEEDEDDTDEGRRKHGLQKQRAMPSSPTNMFAYDEDASNTDDKNELFSSFLKNSRDSANEIDSTPGTQYGADSSDPQVVSK